MLFVVVLCRYVPCRTDRGGINMLPLANLRSKSQVSSSTEEFQYHPSSAQHPEALLSSSTSHAAPLTSWLRGLLSARNNMLHGAQWRLFPAPPFLLILTSLHLPFPSPCARIRRFRRPSLFFYPQLSFRSFPTTPSCPPSSPVSQFMRQELCPSPPRLERRGSSGIPRVAPLSSSSVLPSPLPPPPRLWLLLPSPGVVSLPSGPPLKWWATEITG